MRQPRRRRKGSRSLHLSISATDEEWEIVRRNAARRRKSIARYLVGLALGEDSTAMDSTGPEVALDPSEQREGLDILRRIDQYVGDEDSSPLVVDLQARVAVIFDGWAKGMVAEGRSRELRDTLVHVVGEEHADTLMASLGTVAAKAGTGTAYSRNSRSSGRRRCRAPCFESVLRLHVHEKNYNIAKFHGGCRYEFG